eukprot:1522955-Rhodomonas_salina.2
MMMRRRRPSIARRAVRLARRRETLEAQRWQCNGRARSCSCVQVEDVADGDRVAVFHASTMSGKKANDTTDRSGSSELVPLPEHFEDHNRTR